MVENKAKAIKSLFLLELKKNDLAFLFLGYSGILLRLGDFTIAIDPGQSLTHTEVPALKHLDLLLFTHNHWDHFKKDHTLEIIKQTRPHTIADIVSFKELKAHIPPDMLTKADPASKSSTYQVCETEVTALQGIHAGPISQYLINLGRIKIFHGGDSGYWRRKETSASKFTSASQSHLPKNPAPPVTKMRFPLNSIHLSLSFILLISSSAILRVILSRLLPRLFNSPF